jgi:hypothetical protein
LECDHDATTMKMHSKVRWGNVDEVATLLKTKGTAECQVSRRTASKIHSALHAAETELFLGPTSGFPCLRLSVRAPAAAASQRQLS